MITIKDNKVMGFWNRISDEVVSFISIIDSL